MNDKVRTTRSLELLLILMLSCTLLFWTYASAEAEQSTGTLLVNGEAEVRVVPDMATFTVGVQTLADTADEARRLNANKMSAVRQRLTDLGVPEEALRTTGMQMYPEWHIDQDDGSRTIVGYRFTNNLEVTVYDLDQLIPWIDAAVAEGGTQLSGPVFGLRHQDKIEEEVLRLAVERARKKAEVISEATGTKLQHISHISEQVHLPMGRSSSPSLMAMDVSFAEQSSVVAPGELTVTARVSITFHILP